MAVTARDVEQGYLDSPDESIGQRVRSLRKARGWSLDRLAQEARKEGATGVGLSRGTIWEMEADPTRQPWDATLRAIAAALDVPVEYLRTGRMPASEQSLAEFTPELYARSQGLRDPRHLRLVRELIEDFKILDARYTEDDPEE